MSYSRDAEATGTLSCEGLNANSPSRPAFPTPGPAPTAQAIRVGKYEQTQETDPAWTSAQTSLTHFAQSEKSGQARAFHQEDRHPDCLSDLSASEARQKHVIVFMRTERVVVVLAKRLDNLVPTQISRALSRHLMN
jgi:hypothetical protein